MNSPLAERMRPSELSEMVGQKHLLSDSSVLSKLLKTSHFPNLIFYGPPGTGKTTLACIIAKMAGKEFYKLNATVALGKDIKEVLEASSTLVGSQGILLYIDEIQYFNKRQQQTILEYIEDGRVTLVASTTENPYMYIYKAILSRSTVFEFKPLEKDDIEDAVKKGIDFLNREIGATKKISQEAAEYFAQTAGGDLRSALNAEEIAYHISEDEISLETAKTVMTKNPLVFDRDGDIHYELLSAFQKSIRGSDENAALFYLARLLEGGDIISPCRRLLVIACEDIGLAYPQAIAITKACVDSAKELGLPEAKIPLAEATVLLATAPKSNSAYMGINIACEDVKSGKGINMPNYLKNNHVYSAGEEKSEYKYPHNYKNSYIKQQYLPDDIKDKKYYSYGLNKNEQAAKEYNMKIKGEK